MSNNRKFSYASVREEDDATQAFNSSLSSKEFEEIEWIATPCSHWCKTRGLCSKHSGGTHDLYVQTRLEGYARSNPARLQKILKELEKRRECSQIPQTASSPFPQSYSAAFDPEYEEVISLSEEESEVPVTEELPVARQFSPLELLPDEILALIFNLITIDRTADPYARPNVDLVSLALTSKALRAVASRVMYQHVSFPQSKAFFKFCRSLSEDPSLGGLVRCLDFSHYSSIGFGRTRTISNQTPYLTPTTLKACLDRLPKLKAFLVHEHVDDELDSEVLARIFRMSSLTALDLCACSSKPFTEAMTQLCDSFSCSASSSIKRLSLHECTTLQEPVFEKILPQLTNLTHLDLAHTLVNDEALLSIPHTAQITHLNLERCTHLTGEGVVEFLTRHPAVKDSVVYLNLMADSSRHRLLSENDVTTLLANLPSTLRSLNLGGARINSSHVPALQKLCSHLEELGLKGASLGLSSDIAQLVNMEANKQTSSELPPSQLRYLDLTDISSVNQLSLCYSPIAMTSPQTMPLEVIEVGSVVLEEMKRRNAHVKRPEWAVSELGRRGWYVRQAQPEKGVLLDDGARSWKMGARWWGMRKIPMVEQEVGGMYGYFMFKRT